MDRMAIGRDAIGSNGYWTKLLLDQMAIGPNYYWIRWLLDQIAILDQMAIRPDGFRPIGTGQSGYGTKWV